MSSGAGQVCRRMGIAEAIAITMMVSAKNLAMIFRFRRLLDSAFASILSARTKTSRPECGSQLKEGPSAIFGLTVTRYASLGLEGEVGRPGLPCRHRHLLGLCTVFFLPSSYGVISRRHVLYRVRALFVGGCIGPFYHNEIAMHPWMNVALHRYRDLFRLPTHLNRRGAWRLRFVPWNIAGERVRKRVNVVGRLVAGHHFEFL